MHGRFKFTAFLVVLVSILFYAFFEISKHDAALSNVNPFANDPYDAIGSFGIQAAAALAALSLLRAFWPYPGGGISENRKALLARTQMMAVLAVGITLAGDAVAMLRYPSLWVRSEEGHRLAALFAGMVLLTVIAGLLVHRLARRIVSPQIPNARSRAVIVSFAAVIILAFYPESWRHSMTGALFTVIVGATLLFIPMWALGIALVPDGAETVRNDPATLAWSYWRKYQWSFIVFVGVLTGSFLALAELRGPGEWTHPTGRILLVVSVYVGLETTGLLIGYALLKKPLGLFLQNSQHS